jgi:ATP-dependent Lhr-like helicase
VVRVGPQTERSFARGHYRDLLASFSGSPLLTGRHGAAEVGYIDPTVLTGERDERLLLLAGRSWRVTDVDWSKRIVWLEPAAGGGKARWMGGARSLARDVCQGIRSVLADGASPTVTLSRRAQAALQALTDEIPVSSGTHFVMSRSDGAPMQTWTFAGTRANRTLARQASIGTARVRFDALSVQAPVAALPATPLGHIDLTGDEIAAFHESIKFADCVPRQLLSRTIVARNFEVTNGPSSNAV